MWDRLWNLKPVFLIDELSVEWVYITKLLFRVVGCGYGYHSNIAEMIGV